MTDHLKEVSTDSSIRVVTIVGGMAPEKQQRLLGRKPEIVVATPGRLWELISQGEEHLQTLGGLVRARSHTCTFARRRDSHAPTRSSPTSRKIPGAFRSHKKAHECSKPCPFRVRAQRFLVLDEADRMVERGHFAELVHILDMIEREFAAARLRLPRNVTSRASRPLRCTPSGMGPRSWLGF